MNKKGMTLVEVLLVIVLIAIIAIIALPNIMNALKSSKSEGGKTLEQLLEKNLELYNQTNKEDLWANKNVSNVCIAVSWDELKSVNDDISFGECKLYKPSGIEPLVIKKLGTNKYEYYANIICGKAFQSDDVFIAPGQFNTADVTYQTTKKYDCDMSWQNEAKEYTVSLQTESGNTVSGESQKTVLAYSNATFSVTLSDANKESIVTCNNNQIGTINGNTVVVSNVTADTTCTFTTLNVATCPTTISSYAEAYDGAEHSISVSNDATGGTVEYSTDQSVWTATKPVVKDVGEKAIYVRVNGDATHSTKTCGNTPTTVSVSERYINIKADNHTMTYGESAPELSYTVLNAVAGDVAVSGTPNYVVTGSSGTVTDLSKAPAGTYTISVSGLTAASNYKIDKYNNGVLTINKKYCPVPTNLSVSTAGIVTWGGGNSDCNKFKISLNGTSWTENVTSGYNMLSAITANSGAKTIYLKSFSSSSDSFADSSAATESVTVVPIAFTSTSSAAGSVSKTSMNVISGTTLESSENNLIIKGVTTGSTKTTLATITPTANSGYKFDKWSKTSGTFELTTTITADFAAIEYAISYDLNGGSAENPDSYKITTNTFTLANPTKNGYEFLGWTGSNGTTPQKNVSIEKGSTGDKSYTANWEAESYQITYNLDGGIAENNPTSYTVSTDTFTLNNPTKTSYKFLGWTGSNGTTPQKTVSIEKGSVGDKSYTANWEIEVMYTVKYNPNGGTDALFTYNDETHPWIESSGVWKSGNYRVNDTISTITTKEFTLTSQDTLSFDWAVSSESAENDFLYYTIYKDGSVIDETGMPTAIGGNRNVTDEADLAYSTVSHVLSPGTYKVSFSYYKDSSTSRGLDRGYVKNVKLAHTNLTEMNDSTYLLEESKALTKNIFTKNHYKFIGWSMDENATTPTYSDEEVVKNLSTVNNDVVNLYAIWEPLNYTVDVVVNEGVVDTASKTVVYNNDVTFTVTPNEAGRGYVSCTNGQHSSIEGSTLTVSNVSDNTVCTVGFSTIVSTLFEDGTLIVNEQLGSRDTNISTHGEVVTEYESLSNRNVYYFTDATSQLWYGQRESITNVLFGSQVNSIATSYWFNNLVNLKEANFANLNSSGVTDMKYMFNNAGSSANSFTLTNLNTLDTSNVTNMDHMFAQTAYDSNSVSIGDISGWNTGRVEDMNNMFYQFAYNLNSFSLLDLSSWDVSRVQDMSQMFYQAGNKAASSWTLGDLSGWVTENVYDMHNMFYQAGQYASSWSIGDISSWDVSRVTSMNNMFNSSGQNASSWNIGTLASWNVSNVSNMESMFAYAGFNSSSFALDLSGWNVSNVSAMIAMFRQAGFKSSSWSVGDLSNWDISNVSDVSAMFEAAGHDASTWTSIGTLKIYANDIHIILKDCPNAKATLNLYNNPNNYEDALLNASTVSGSSIIVNYANAVTDIDNIIATKGASSNVVKGSVLS